MKVTTDACLFGAWCAVEIKNIGVKPETGLDIGTGTGLLSLQIVQKNDLAIDAIEVDREAALQAKENMVCSAWKNKIEVINVDAMKFNSPKKYDVIFSNPPFYEFELQSSNAKRNLAHHGHGLKSRMSCPS
jgi:tRNA1Val (adenine37-N6)-methyltransferase